MSYEKPTQLDLFSGIGGFSLAAESVGFRTIGFSEIDTYASAVLRKHWPDVPNFGDVRNVTGGCIGHVDLITGGFPCQPFSVAGKKLGDSDERHLWPELVRILSEVRPRFALFENVPGLLSISGGRVFNGILSDLCKIGYDCIWNLVPASAVGANHQRDRLWIVAYSRHNARSSEQQCKCETSSKESIGMCEADVADTRSFGERSEKPRGNDEGSSSEPIGCCEMGDTKRQGLEGNRTRWTARNSDWWSVEPNVGRVAHGIPKRMDRLKCLGNSIVPQVAEVFLKEIYKQLVS